MTDVERIFLRKNKGIKLQLPFKNYDFQLKDEADLTNAHYSEFISGNLIVEFYGDIEGRVILSSIIKEEEKADKRETWFFFLEEDESYDVEKKLDVLVFNPKADLNEGDNYIRGVNWVKEISDKIDLIEKGITKDS